MTDLAREVFRGKSIGRILFNRKVREHGAEYRGKILDLGAGSTASYLRYLPAGLDITSTDLEGKSGIDKAVDLNSPLPFTDESFDTVFLFNVLYILEDRIATLREIRRVLKRGGKLYLSSPFISPEIPEPHDYCRLTNEGLEKECKQSGFSSVTVERIGGRASAAAAVFNPFFVFNAVRLAAYGICLWLDSLYAKRERKHPTPISYFCIAEK